MSLFNRRRPSRPTSSGPAPAATSAPYRYDPALYDTGPSTDSGGTSSGCSSSTSSDSGSSSSSSCDAGGGG